VRQDVGFDLIWLKRKQKSFFFEKKKQKTFVRCSWLLWPSGRLRYCAKQVKSFLVLFFKKEQLAFCYLGGAGAWDSAGNSSTMIWRERTRRPSTLFGWRRTMPLDSQSVIGSESLPACVELTTRQCDGTPLVSIMQFSVIFAWCGFAANGRSGI
jgi:hypothetical protein